MGGDLPRVVVTSVRRVFHNGEHNAFTDLVRFRGRYSLTFRNCPGGRMVPPTSSIQETAGDETAFLFDWWGRILAIGRRGSAPAQVLRSRPPYTSWDRVDLDRYIGGPLLTRWGNRYVVGGRKVTVDRGPKTSLCWLEGDRLTEFAELPSGGDNSYPGFLVPGHGRALVSYYSTHERDAIGREVTAIYLAELRLTD